jgi:hypothetical protein
MIKVGERVAWQRSRVRSMQAKFEIEHDEIMGGHEMVKISD